MDFLISAFIFFLPIIVVGIFITKAQLSYFRLYRKIINPDIPLLPLEGSEYLAQGFKSIWKFYAAPGYMLKMLFEKHKNKSLNDAAKKVRLLYLLYFFIIILELFILTVSWGWYS